MSLDENRWHPPTMRSILRLAENPLVTCGCGRSVNADMMRATRDGFACDSCNEARFRSGELAREEFARFHGAPEHVLAKARVQDSIEAARLKIEVDAARLLDGELP